MMRIPMPGPSKIMIISRQSLAANNQSHGRLMPVAVLLLSSLILNACGARGDGSSGDSGGGLGGATDSGLGDGPACELDVMREWIHDNMNDYYLFYDQLPSVNLADYNQADGLAALSELTKDLRVAPFDRYSYVANKAQNSAFFEEGKLFDYGMRLLRASDNSIRFALILEGSPFDAAGVKRGDQLLAIDSFDIEEVINRNLWSELLGTGTAVLSPRFTIESQAGQRETLTVTKAEFALKTVVATDVVQNGASKVGYLHFLSFLETSRAELSEAFAALGNANIDELVLDLRFNGGGRISVASELASLIVGDSALNRDFTRFAYNDKYAQFNSSLPFVQTNNALNLSRVFVLTTGQTCSASEMVINGLRPFMEVITVGSTSCGKPYGTHAEPRCNVVLNALEVKFENDAGTGDYYDGLTADCAARDDVVQPLGSTNEPIFATALNYMNTGSCQLVAYRSKAGREGGDIINPMEFGIDGMFNRIGE
jgi:C-terminal processing protease CtpA/Prc